MTKAKHARNTYNYSLASEKNMKRFFEASSFAGYGLIISGIGLLITSHGADPSGYAMIVSGIAAVVRGESTPAPK